MTYFDEYLQNLKQFVVLTSTRPLSSLILEEYGRPLSVAQRWPSGRQINRKFSEILIWYNVSCSFDPFVPGDHLKVTPNKETCSFQLQVCVSKCDLRARDTKRLTNTQNENVGKWKIKSNYVILSEKNTGTLKKESAEENLFIQIFDFVDIVFSYIGTLAFRRFIVQVNIYLFEKIKDLLNRNVDL